MKTENVRLFFEKAKDSSELQEKISKIYADAARTSAQALAELSQNSGSPFTAEEFLAGDAEMSDSEMEAVAGGGGWFADFLIDFIRRCDTPSGRRKPP